jgi:signal transduction histidine kinase
VSAEAARDEWTAELDRRLSAIAHDLQTPLSVIIGYAELLRMRDDEQTRREAPVRIQEAAERLSTLIEDLLAGAASHDERE